MKIKKNYVVQHNDSETDISSYLAVEANSKEEAIKAAEKAIEDFTAGYLGAVMEATEEEIAVLNKFGILCD